MSGRIDLAVIGGSGLYALPGFELLESSEAETPFGRASAAVRIGLLHGRRVVFLARHGEAHAVPPHRVNYRANLYVLAQLAPTAVLAINTVGGITEACTPRALVVPDQIIDYTHGRTSSFWDEAGDMRHVEFGEPYSSTLRARLFDAARHAGVAVIKGGCYGATQGPRFETRAEISRMRRDGCDIVGMTGMPEAALARELDLDYACIAPVANWAAGCGDGAPISLDEVFANLADANQRVQQILHALLA